MSLPLPQHDIEEKVGPLPPAKPPVKGEVKRIPPYPAPKGFEWLPDGRLGTKDYQPAKVPV